MALADQLDKTPKRQSGMPCSVGALLDRLEKKSPSEREALEKMLGELGWSATAIFDAVEEEGEWVAFQTINRHRSRACCCFRQPR